MKNMDIYPYFNSADEELLLPEEVAFMFRVDKRTVNRWADQGRLTIIRTLGGHRRYLKSEVKNLLERQQGR